MVLWEISLGKVFGNKSNTLLSLRNHYKMVDSEYIQRSIFKLRQKSDSIVWSDNSISDTVSAIGLYKLLWELERGWVIYFLVLFTRIWPSRSLGFEMNLQQALLFALTQCGIIVI